MTYRDWETKHKIEIALDLSLETQFNEHFNFKLSDYLTVVNTSNLEELPYDLLTKLNSMPDIVRDMTRYIDTYNVKFRELLVTYIKNPFFVNVLSVTDDCVGHYIRLKYRQLGDMETYTMLIQTKLYALSLDEINDLLQPLEEKSFVINKLNLDDQYPIRSNQATFKSSFLS